MIKLKLVGYEKIEYTKKDGTEVKGAKLHVVYDVNDEGYDNIDKVVGQPVEAIYVSSSVPVPALKVGDNIDVRFNRYNRPVKVTVVSA